MKTPSNRWLTILAFGCVYLFWGSTFLGIRIAVERLPPALMCGTRFLIAGASMLIYCGLAGKKIRCSAAQLARLAAVGMLLLVGGNLTLSYAERIVPSGLAALMWGSSPLWFLILDSLLLKSGPISRRSLAGLLLGMIGIVVLLWPKLAATGALGSRELLWSAGLLAGTFSWALGSVLAKRWQDSAVDPFVGTAWQILFAGLANLLFAALFEDVSHAAWTARGLGAVLYLVIAGSWIGYTAYLWLIRHQPISKVSTYAYINPLVAVFLGWLLGHERVDAYILAGSAIVIASVVLVTGAGTAPKNNPRTGCTDKSPILR